MESQETWEYEQRVPRNMGIYTWSPKKHGNINMESQETWNINIKSQETWKYKQTVPRKMGIYTWSPKKHGI